MLRVIASMPRVIAAACRRPGSGGTTLRSHVFATLLLLALASPAWAGTESEAVPPAAAAAQPAAPAPATSVQPTTPAPRTEHVPDTKVDNSYIIGPGDVIQVFVWRNPELTVSVPVRPDGKVSTPLVEDITAVGKTPSALARDIESRLAEYIRSPQVNVIVTTPQSSFSRVTVVGQVKTPGSIAFREGMTILDVMLEVGGLGEFAAGNRAKLVRKDSSGQPVESRVRLDDLVRKGRLKENRSVQPGDVIIVPESVF